MRAEAMPSETRRSLEQAIEQLTAQRRRYALALGAAPTDRARVRHLRNVERLDDEIAAHEEALAAMMSTPDMAVEKPRDGLLERANEWVSGSFARGELDAALKLDRGVVARVIAVAFAVGFLVVALLMAL